MTATLNVAVVVALPSKALTVNVQVPTVVGVQEKTPVVGLITAVDSFPIVVTGVTEKTIGSSSASLAATVKLRRFPCVTVLGVIAVITGGVLSEIFPATFHRLVETVLIPVPQIFGPTILNTPGFVPAQIVCKTPGLPRYHAGAVGATAPRNF